MQSLYGSHWLLRELHPMAVLAIVAIILVMFVCAGRMIFEGLGYNVSYASQVGDLFLGGILAIGAVVLRRDSDLSWTVNGWVHIIVLVVTAAVAYKANQVYAPMFVDKFHNVVILPLFFYFLLTTALVVICGGTKVEITAAVGCFLVWLAFLAYDAMTGRLPQQEFLFKNYGIRLPAWEGKFDFLL